MIMLANFGITILLLAFPGLFPKAPLFLRAISPVAGLLIFLIVISGLPAFLKTILFVCKDGLGVSYGNAPLKLVAWENIEKVSERHPSIVVSTLCFRLKAYGPWLAQFTPVELRERLRAEAILDGLLGWMYMERMSNSNKSVADEISTMPAASLQRKLATRMFRVRKEQGVDLIFPNTLCVKADLLKIEASYNAWLNK